jgi:hypothetical protein
MAKHTIRLSESQLANASDFASDFSSGRRRVQSVDRHQRDPQHGRNSLPGIMFAFPGGFKREVRMKRRSSVARLTELSLLAPQVVAMRTARMALGTDTEGLRRMSDEKMQAYWESMSAMGMQVVKAQREYAMLAMRQWMTAWTVPWTMAGMMSNSSAQQKHLHRSMEKVVEQGMLPVERQVRSNLRRLSRR